MLRRSVASLPTSRESPERSLIDVLCFVTAALLSESDASFSTTCVKPDLTSANINLLVAAVVWSNRSKLLGWESL